ncbi:SidA/IucD/PvdA family monooxygenase [Actinomadura sp. LD22]|uniref:SidA/IucD/PvdA family monooxygenase n=2 Tax=Actinomadura physcomitrii TaxID=2650748 RepID=A0A6I4MLA6_9ACTN|nr:SidA/IucD/PvdA family monooxygenase [Actinomadura physcomitrii]
MYALRKLRDELGMDVHVVERGEDVGGTWYWNRYPGARCDAESIFYSYSFDADLQQEWTWTERFATQPEILDYCRHVADRFDLRRDITFGDSVVGAVFDESDDRWTVRLESGGVRRARFLVTAVGCLAASPRVPDVPGLDDFAGATYHTGRWPHEGVDFTGLRVAVIGTGSSGIQVIPEIAKQAAALTVFQRTPSYSVPARNRVFAEDEIARLKREYPALRAEARQTGGGSVLPLPPGKAGDLSPEQQRAELRKRWELGGPGYMFAFADSMVDEKANAVAADFVREQIREIVRDQDVARLLCPTTYPIGAKRICVDTDYYATYNRDNVTLVDVSGSPIERVTPKGLEVGGHVHEVDAIVFATGYDAMTGPLLQLGLRGVGGRTLAEKWAAGPRTYLGLATADFPNLFMITAPGSPSVLTNMVASAEQHVDWIAAHLEALRAAGATRVEAEVEAEDAWVEQVNTAASFTLFPQGNSWYIGANVPGKPRVFMPYVGGYALYGQQIDEVARDGYRGFRRNAVLEKGERPGG